MYSGGLGSFGAAHRVIEAHGKEGITLLFTDTLIEDEDLYRFLDDTELHFGVPVTRIKDGRDPWRVFNEVRFLGNTRIDPCSRILKRELADRWLVENCDPSSTTVHLGIDWTEQHRFDDGKGGGARLRYQRNGWRAEAPLCQPPYLWRSRLYAMLETVGIKPPRLYAMGFVHNNCGGFCIKAGQGHFALLLKTMPERYRLHEEEELALVEKLGAEVAILRDRRGGKTRPMTLRDFRLRIEAKQAIDEDEIGGCGCFVDT